MSGQPVIRRLVVSLCAVLMLVVAAPTYAQMGSVRGKVVDEAGNPVPNADVSYEFVGGDVDRSAKGRTNAKGEFVQAGLLVAGGRWRVSVTTKDGKSGRSLDLDVPTGSVFAIPDIVVKPGKLAPASDPKMNKDELEKLNKRNADLEKRFNESKVDIEAGNFAAAITKLEGVANEVEKCGVCYIRIGDAYMKLKDLPNAEKAFLMAISFEGKTPNPDPYSALATIYNEQKRLDEAAQMSQKASDLQAASGGPVDPVAVYNQGVILWNQGKGAEAAAQFQKAVAANPRNPEAQYMLGLTLYSSGKMAEAKAPLQEYLKLAPTGTNADGAKALLATIK
jgi:tetratricopeptide (TPR) repeat protein